MVILILRQSICNNHENLHCTNIPCYMTAFSIMSNKIITFCRFKHLWQEHAPTRHSTHLKCSFRWLKKFQIILGGSVPSGLLLDKLHSLQARERCYGAHYLEFLLRLVTLWLVHLQLPWLLVLHILDQCKAERPSKILRSFLRVFEQDS